MREELEKIYGERKKFIGTFKRFGKKRDYNGNIVLTVLLINVKDENGEFVADHLWFNYTKRFHNAFISWTFILGISAIIALDSFISALSYSSPRYLAREIV